MRSPLSNLILAAAIVVAALAASVGGAAAADPQRAEVELHRASATDLTWIPTPVNVAPQYDNEWICFQGEVWTDFTDADDDDYSLTVVLGAHTPTGFHWVVMDVSSPPHGAFWHANLQPYGGIWSGIVRAIDPHGASSPWIPVSC